MVAGGDAAGRRLRDNLATFSHSVQLFFRPGCAVLQPGARSAWRFRCLATADRRARRALIYAVTGAV